MTDRVRISASGYKRVLDENVVISGSAHSVRGNNHARLSLSLITGIIESEMHNGLSYGSFKDQPI